MWWWVCVRWCGEEVCVVVDVRQSGEVCGGGYV